ncbi:MAG: 30S ribosomal protein S6 [bacterium]
MEQEMNELKNRYELSFVTQSEEATSVKALLAKNNAQIVNERPISKIQLAYKINKQGYGFTGTTEFWANAESVVSLRKDLQLEKDVLRGIIIKLKEIKIGEVGVEEKSSEKTPSGPQRIRNMFSGVLSNEALEKKIEEILQ